jgi:hypothetical protein
LAVRERRRQGTDEPQGANALRRAEGRGKQATPASFSAGGIVCNAHLVADSILAGALPMNLLAHPQWFGDQSCWLCANKTAISRATMIQGAPYRQPIRLRTCRRHDRCTNRGRGACRRPRCPDTTARGSETGSATHTHARSQRRSPAHLEHIIIRILQPPLPMHLPILDRARIHRGCRCLVQHKPTRRGRISTRSVCAQ